ncbi:MAG: hypothetical protein ACREGB_01695 [Candidatus Saccharimonadales bacterium]
MAIFKAQAHARELKQRLFLSIKGVTLADAADSADGFPVLFISRNSENMFVKIQMLPDTAAHVDGLGLPQRLYSPHQCLLVEEPAATAIDFDMRYRVLDAVAKLGMKLDIYEGTGVVTDTTYAAALAHATTLVSDIRSDEVHPLTESQ